MKQIITFIFLLFTSVSALAQEPVTGTDLDDLLNGKTANGIWLDDSYRQWFSNDGTTIYAPKGKRSSLGKWRVSKNGKNYESQWGNGAWETYSVVEKDGTYFWVTPEGVKFAFEILEGQQLNW